MTSQTTTIESPQWVEVMPGVYVAWWMPWAREGEQRKEQRT